METWTGGSPVCLPASCQSWGPLLWFVCKVGDRNRKAVWGLRLLSLSGLHRRLYSDRRVQSPPPDIGARSPVLRRQHSPSWPWRSPLCDQTPSFESITLDKQSPPLQAPTTPKANSSALRPVTFQLSPGASNQDPPSRAAGGMRRKSPSKELAAA